MNKTKRYRIMRVITLCVLVCSIIVTTIAPAAFAATTTRFYALVTASELNVRSGPGTANPIVYTASYGDKIYLTGFVLPGIDYKWYKVYGADYYIADTGGWTLCTETYEEVSSDTISGYDAYGQLAWSHDCSVVGTEWYYHLEVENDYYLIRCDCGWWYQRSVSFTVDPDTGERITTFIGLDTDNDERIDLKPGQSKKLLCRANSDLRKYIILEFLGSANLDIPSVTLKFADADDNLIAEYVFNWSVDVYVLGYGIKMVGNDGTTKIHYVEDDFLLYDQFNEFFLGDTGVCYKVDLSMKDQYGNYLLRHVEFVFTLAPPGEGGLGPLEWISIIVRDIGDFISDLLDFFNLGFIFTDVDSPFRFLIGG